MDKSVKQKLSDEELMSLYITGDFAAFEILYKRHSGRVFDYLKKKVSAETAQDLLQEIFAKLHKSRAKYNPQYPFLPWLFTVARNSLMDFYKLAETKLTKASSGSDELLSNLPSVAANEAGNVDLALLLADLPPNQKRAIELRYLEDWSFEKIATHMNTSEGNARQLISRGLAFVRQLRKGGKSEF
jgi:RNA polymerase sigma-70 factor (ECF subfamily)